jgi:hypothetical protein
MNRTTRPEKPPADHTLEEWLRIEGVARYDAFSRNPRGKPA